MKLTKFFKQQVNKWNEDNKCGYCYEFHAPLTEDALNKQHLINPCCVQVMLTEDRMNPATVSNQYSTQFGLLSDQWITQRFNLYFIKPQGLDINNYDENLNHPIEESKSEFLENLKECIIDTNLDFCLFLGSQWQVTQWELSSPLTNYRDYNYTGYRLSVTIRKRKQF